jgi:predicted membrane channel-forming protein YqfA (hemolysin III family)
MMEPYRPSWRKPAGMFMILGLIVLLAFIVGSFSHSIARLPAWAQIPVYIIAGIIWIMPLKPLLSWMETGRWRRPK